MTETPFTLIITRADEVVSSIAQQPVVAVLSIEHPDALPQKGAAPRLDNMPQKILCFWDSEVPVKDGPDLAQVKAGIDFVLDHITKGPVLVHCHAGKARSAGIVLGVLSRLHPDWTEIELIDHLLKIRPIAAPNILVVEMADQLTGRNGKLLEAVKNHPALTQRRLETEKNRQHWIAKNPDIAHKMFPEKFPKP